MKRVSNAATILVLLLLVLAACSSGEPSPSAAGASTAASVPPAESSTPAPTPPPASSVPEPSAGSGSASDLADLLPDQVQGMDHGPDVDFGNNPMFQSLLQSQGGEGLGDIEYIIRTWGEGELTLSAMRVPGMAQPQLELIAKAMSGAVEGQGTVEELTLDGKSVLRIQSPDQPGTAAYMYFGADAVFTIVSPSMDLAWAVVAQLP